MTSPSTTSDVITAIEEIYGRLKKIHRDLRPSDRIVADLEVDSLATLEILVELEQRFDVNLVDDPRATKVDTVGDLVELIEDLR